MHAPRQPGPLSVQVTQKIQAKLIESPTARRTIEPTLVRLEARVTPSSNKVDWLLVTYNGEECGWPLAAVATLFDDDAIRIFINGKEIDSLEALPT